MELNEYRCTCGEEEIEPHDCPYAEEFRPPDVQPDPEYFCQCCNYCAGQCAMDI